MPTFRPGRRQTAILSMALGAAMFAIGSSQFLGAAPAKDSSEGMVLRELRIETLHLQGRWESREQWELPDALAAIPPQGFSEEELQGKTFHGAPKPTKVSDDRLVVDSNVIRALIEASEPTQLGMPEDCRPCLQWDADSGTMGPTLEHAPSLVDGMVCCTLSERHGPSGAELQSGVFTPSWTRTQARLMDGLEDREGVPAGPGWIQIERDGSIEIGGPKDDLARILLGITEDGSVYFWYGCGEP